MHLGFAVQVLGRPQLKSHDSRRWQNSPHLSVSLAYLRDILVYLQDVGIRLYRMHPDLAPYVTHPAFPQFHHQVAECAQELAYLGQLARKADIRLSFHTDPYTVLNSPDGDTAQQSLRKLTVLAEILEAMELGREAVVVTHVGGIFGDKNASLEQFMRAYEHLPGQARSRLALENDENRYSLPDIYRIHQLTGVRLVFDRLHFLLNNPQRMSVHEGLAMALSTWPSGVRPKMHFSSPRTEMKAVPTAEAEEEEAAESARSPLWSNHSDYINPFEFIDFARLLGDSPAFDVMVEAKGKDLAVIRLRRDLARFAPELVI